MPLLGRMVVTVYLLCVCVAGMPLLAWMVVTVYLLCVCVCSWDAIAWADGGGGHAERQPDRPHPATTAADIHPAPFSSAMRRQPDSIEEDSGGIYSDIPDPPNLPPPDSTVSKTLGRRGQL